MVKLIFFLTAIFPCLLFASAKVHESLSTTSLETLNTHLNFQLVGKTTFSILFWDIYKSKLLTTTGKYPVNNIEDQLIYEINYLADISKADLIQRTVDQWKHIGKIEKDYLHFIPELENIWPDINEGDTLSLLIHNEVNLFYFNQHYIGNIKSAKFGQLFLDIWLAKNTSQPNLRLELLGEKNYD